MKEKTVTFSTRDVHYFTPILLVKLDHLFLFYLLLVNLNCLFALAVKNLNKIKINKIKIKYN